MKRLVIIFLALLWGSFTLVAQQKSYDALNADYPLLMQKFGDELGEQRADYIFAIDVSGTMGKYRETVVPALGEFFRSLQDGDYVSIIKFGSEATNEEVGSAGKIGPGTVSSLIEFAGRIYDVPTKPYEREKYYNWTDLDNMLHCLAKDMKQIGRNHLKFVFIITDFVHDASSARRGHEDWEGAKQAFAIEQADNDVYVFALQLPGSGRDLERVRGVFPKSFRFNHVPITNGQTLSDWFTQRKNDILLDKFIALVSHKMNPADFSINPTIDFEGHFTLDLSWKPNPVYDCLQLDDISLSGVRDIRINSSLPQTTTLESVSLSVGTVSKEGTSLFKPAIRSFDGDITLQSSFSEPYTVELGRMGFKAPVLQASAPVSGKVFFYPLPFWLFCTIIGLILLYIILVIRAFVRNSSDTYRINGRFEVMSDGLPVTNRKGAAALDTVDFGRAAAFMPVPNANWGISISVKRYNPFILFFKRPMYIVCQTRGNGFKTNGVKWGPQHTPKIAPYSNILVGTHVIRWIQ